MSIYHRIQIKWCCDDFLECIAEGILVVITKKAEWSESLGLCWSIFNRNLLASHLEQELKGSSWGLARNLSLSVFQSFDVDLREGGGEASIKKSEKRAGVDLCGYFWLVMMILPSQECWGLQYLKRKGSSKGININNFSVATWVKLKPNSKLMFFNLECVLL